MMSRLLRVPLVLLPQEGEGGGKEHTLVESHGGLIRCAAEAVAVFILRRAAAFPFFFLPCHAPE